MALGLRATAIVCGNVTIGNRSAALDLEIASACRDAQRRFGSPADIRRDVAVARFREIHRSVGAGPKKDVPSVETLCRYALKRADLPRINNLVDAYNLVSLRTMCSMGAHDVDRIALPIGLAVLDGTEAFIPLGKRAPSPVSAGQFGYVDGDGRLLCRLDVVQAEFSKVTATTRTAVVIIESTDTHEPDQVDRAVAEAAELIGRECGGSV